MKAISISQLPFCIALLALALSATAQGGTVLEESSSESDGNSAVEWTKGDYLAGDLGGVRDTLEERGVSFDLSYTGFSQGTLSGAGSKTFEYGDRFDALINLDTGKLGLWEGGGFHTHLEYNFGKAPISRGGALIPTNMAAGLPLDYPDELVASSLYFSQRFSDSASMMIGKINMIDLLASDPFFGGWGNERFKNVALVAPLNGALPQVMMGGIFNYKIDPITWTLMIYDPNIQTDNYALGDLFSDGVNVSLAGTWTGEWAGRPSSVNVQAIYSTQEKQDLRDSFLPPDLQTGRSSRIWHASVKVAHLLVESPTKPGEGLGIYGKAGISDGKANVFQAFFSGGLAAHGMIPGRRDDVVGLGYYYYNFSDELQSVVAPLADFEDEQGVELFYNFAVTPFFHVSADLQWIDPGNGSNPSAWLGALRASVTF
jgi:porin